MLMTKRQVKDRNDAMLNFHASRTLRNPLFARIEELRRIMATGKMTDADREELSRLCKQC